MGIQYENNSSKFDYSKYNILIKSFLKKNNIFFEVVAEVQNDIFEIEKTLSMKVNDLYNYNNQWYHKFNAIN